MRYWNQNGFSLLEVVISASLLAVLTTLSVPPYKKYLRRSKTAEAKVSLSQVYQAEKAFFIQWRFYTHNLALIGASPEGELLYNVGFATDKTEDVPNYYQGPKPNEDPNVSNFYALCGADIDKEHEGKPPRIGCGFVGKKQPPDIPSDSTTKVSNKTPKEFIAAAIADLKNKEPKNINSTDGKDIWTIDQYRRVKHIQDGTN